MAEDYLAHYQIKGAKHGVRRFQNLDGSLTPEGRVRYGVGEPRNKSTSATSVKKKVQKGKKDSFVKQAIAKNKAKKEAKKAKTEADKHEAMMKELRKHPAKAYKHRMELTTDDVKRLTTEIDFDHKLKDIRDAEIKRGWDKVNKISSNIKTVYDLMNTGKNMYNIGAEVYNTLIDSGKLTGNKKLKIGEKPDNKEDRSAIEKLIKSANWTEIEKKQSEMTTSELQDAYKRKTALKGIKG